MICRNIQTCSSWLRAVWISLLVVSGCIGSAAVAASTAPAAAGVDNYAAGLPQKVQEFMRDADSSLKSGSLNLAVINLKNAVQLAPGAGEPRARLGMLLLRQGDTVRAERELRQAQKDGARTALVVPGILQVMLLRNETKQLLAEFSDPPDPKYASMTSEILSSRAVALQKLGRATEAMTTINEAIKLHRTVTTLFTGATLARQQNNPILARQLVDETLKLAPANTVAHAMSIDLYREAGQLPEALTEANSIVKLDAGNVNAAILRIEVLLDLNQVAEAKRDVDALLTRTPDPGLAISIVPW